MRRGRRPILRTAVLTFALAAGVSGPAQSPAGDGTGWLEIRYDRLVDGRTLTHSGEPLSVVLNRLGGRPWPEAGDRAAAGDRLAHRLIDPWMEPYAFVALDALDSLDSLDSLDAPPATGGRRWVELGSLWLPGEVQPAWVELLRARRYVVQSDGAGAMRLILPYEGEAPTDRRGRPLLLDSRAAEEAFRSARPVLRHVLRAELRRLRSADAGGAARTLALTVHASVARPERATMLLGRRPWRTAVDEDALARSTARAFDAEAWARAAAAGALAGARIEPDGRLRFWAETGSAHGGLLGGDWTLGDLAVAWRAVAHGGRAEPYMSLDRAESPWRSIVNYGGRLRDTRLGWVSLLCDVRFKTFSNGLGFFEGEDLRTDVRASLPEFATHLERLARDPASAGLTGQQTRLWFYPDAVDLTLSPQLDVLGFRRVRMSAASERLALAEADADVRATPPWTRTTIERINADYDRLAERFPEMRDLDQVVRLLSLATWLKAARDAGRPIPDLDALLDVPLPATPTPRTFPQLLAFHALPPAGRTEGDVWALDRVRLAERWSRLDRPFGERPSAAGGLAIERAMLDADDPAQAAWLARAAAEAANWAADTLDLEAYRAKRLWMHRNVLRSLEGAELERLLSRRDREGVPRLFSLGIGGIDLGMDRALARALGGATGLTLPVDGRSARTIGDATGSAAPQREARERSTGRTAGTRIAPATGTGASSTFASPALGPAAVVPDFLAPSPRRRYDEVVRPDGAGGGRLEIERHHPDAPSARWRVVERASDGTIAAFARVEGESAWRYRFAVDGDRWRAEPADRPDWSELGPAAPLETVPPGVAWLTLRPRAATRDLGAELEVRLGDGVPRSAEWNARLLRKLVAGPEAWPAPQRTLPGWTPLPAAFADVDIWVVAAAPADRAAPWDPSRSRSGELVPERFARGLGEWIGPPVVFATDGARSLTRRTLGASIPKRVGLVLPADGFAFPNEGLRSRLAAAWSAGPVTDALPSAVGDTTVLVAAESPGRFAERIRSARAAKPTARLLAWNLIATPRTDRAPVWLDAGGWAGLAIAEGGVTATRDAAADLAELSAAIRDGRGRPWESLSDRFLWYY